MFKLTFRMIKEKQQERNICEEMIAKIFPNLRKYPKIQGIPSRLYIQIQKKTSCKHVKVKMLKTKDIEEIRNLIEKKKETLHKHYIQQTMIQIGNDICHHIKGQETYDYF